MHILKAKSKHLNPKPFAHPPEDHNAEPIEDSYLASRFRNCICAHSLGCLHNLRAVFQVDFIKIPHNISDQSGKLSL